MRLQQRRNRSSLCSATCTRTRRREDVEPGVRLARRYEPELLVGLGGGSSMDCAKGINFVYTNGGEMQDYWGVGKASQPMLPMIAVPTTAGTGSETQSFALISDAETHVKMACGDKKASFRVAMLDPELTLTQPPQVTALTGIDAIAHALETYVTTRRNWISLFYSREAWRLLSAVLSRVCCATRRPGGPSRHAAGGLLRRAGHRELDAGRHARLGQSADGDLSASFTARRSPRCCRT